MDLPWVVLHCLDMIGILVNWRKSAERFGVPISNAKVLTLHE